MIALPSIFRPTFGNGYAHNSGESAFPGLWRGLTYAWCTSLGNTGNGFVRDYSGLGNHLDMWTGASSWILSDDTRVPGYVINNVTGSSNQGRALGTYTKIGGDLSFSFWFDHLSSGNERDIFSCGFSNTTPGQWNLRFSSTAGNIIVRIWVNGGASVDTNLVFGPDLTNVSEPWHHLVITRKESTGVISGYMDGMLFDSVTGPTGFCDDAQDSRQLTMADATGNNNFIGDYGNIFVWNRVVSPGEASILNQHHDAPFILSEQVVVPEVTVPPVGNDGAAMYHHLQNLGAY